MARKFSPIVALALIFAIFYEPDNFEPESMRGKRVLITGASSGIGEELAYQYSSMGASVFVTARRGELLKKVVDKCGQLGAQQVHFSVADMTRADDRERLVVEAQKRLGGLDHLILNHAKYDPAAWHGSAQNMSQLRRDLDVNFVSYVDVASKSLPMLKESKGNVGVVTSLAGKIGFPLSASYSADKFALHGFFSSLRQELIATDAQVSVTLCVLGYIDTERANEAVAKVYQMADSMPSPAPVDETALVIIKGVTKRAYEILYPRSSRFAVFLHKIAPGYVENYFGSMIAKDTLAHPAL